MIGVVLLNMGGPDSLEAVKPFLLNLFNDRDIIRLGPAFLQSSIAKLIVNKRLKESMHNYSLIGGKSPLLEITKAQASALEACLKAKGKGDFRLYVGMRYWHPFIEDTIRQMYDDGIRDVVALTLYPHFSRATTGTSMKVFEQVAKKFDLNYSLITSWYDHEGYINALVSKINEAMQGFHDKPIVLFSAHSLPQKFIEQGDPYKKHTEATITAIKSKIHIEYRLAFQSKTGPVKWLEPSTEDMLKRLAKEGYKDVLVVPISFVSDHIETLYEIDMLYKDLATSLGINLKRTKSLNTSPDFIEALADLVLRNLPQK